MGIPSIYATEPVYFDGEAVWATCEVEWDAEKQAFVNREAGEDWQLVEELSDASTYTVKDETYGRFRQAVRAALDCGLTQTIVEPQSVSTLVRPEENREPEWGPPVF